MEAEVSDCCAKYTYFVSLTFNWPTVAEEALMCTVYALI